MKTLQVSTPQACGPWLAVDHALQRLTLMTDQRCLAAYAISTARNGLGEQMGSGCTPRGWHCIRAKIGADCARNSVFVARRATGECYSPALAQRYPQRDWILTRILWLSGLEVGRNRLGSVDSMRRYIYIHGTPDSEPMGEALSHGCIRMRNTDVMALFEQVAPGIQVHIQ